MERYFEMALIFKYTIPITIIVVSIAAIIIWFVIAYLNGIRRTKVMEKLGYRYESGLGPRASYEYQPHWVKGYVRINSREIDRLKVRQIRAFVEKKEGRNKTT